MLDKLSYVRLSYVIVFDQVQSSLEVKKRNFELNSHFLWYDHMTDLVRSQSNTTNTMTRTYKKSHKYYIMKQFFGHMRLLSTIS